MSLKNFNDVYSYLRHTWFIYLVLSALLLIGCGEVEETVMEEPQPQEEVIPLEKVSEETPKVSEETPKVSEETPKNEKPMDQALTSFVGSDTEKPVEAPKPVPATPTQLAQYERQIEDLRTENTGLKEKIVKLDQENRGINARMTEVETKYAAEKLRADKADELAKNAALAPKTVEVSQRQSLVDRHVSSTSVSMSSYEDALKAFNSRRYDDAADGLKAIIASGDNDDLTNRAKYWLGESYFAKKKYKEALPFFQDALKFKHSEKKADAQFMIAQTYERLGNKTKAKEAYEKVVKDYPMSRNVKLAKERWAKL